MRWNITNGFAESLVSVYIQRVVANGCGGGVRAKVALVFEVLARSNGSRAKTPAAVGADIKQDLVNTLPAEGAFK